MKKSDPDHDEAMDAMQEYMMPGGKGTSMPMKMEKSRPVNQNPHHNAKDMSPEKCGTGRGKHGAC